MPKPGKRYRQVNEAIDPAKLYTLQDAMELLKSAGATKFDESVDIAVNLGTAELKLGQHRDAAGVSELERAARVDGVKEILDGDAVGAVLDDQRGQPGVNREQLVR